MKNIKATEIAKINDAFRAGLIKRGRRLMTDGIAALPMFEKQIIVVKVQAFSAFNADNDPHGEHNFGSFEQEGHKIFWKIDTFSLTPYR